MKVFRDLPNTKNREYCAITIGNFDGVHLGHKMLLAQARAAANARHLPLTVMTFEPHTREFFNFNTVTPRISLLRDKLEAFAKCNVDRVIIKYFNSHFASLLPEVFVRDILVTGLQTRYMLVGDDFHYGIQRSGNFTSLAAAGIYYGFEVEHANSFTDANCIRISSSSIRTALILGNLSLVNKLLGHSYSMSGHVIHGKKLGKFLGFPTLNIKISHKIPAITGIFVVLVHNLLATPLHGVASIGLRPTVDNSGRFLLEVHILNWNGNAYGKLVRIEFLQKLRSEEQYLNLSTLKEAINQDVKNAYAWFKHY